MMPDAHRRALRHAHGHAHGMSMDMPMGMPYSAHFYQHSNEKQIYIGSTFPNTHSVNFRQVAASTDQMLSFEAGVNPDE